MKKCLLIYVGQSDMNFTLASVRDYDIKREPQIGFAYLAAILREKEVDAAILDFTLKPLSLNGLNNYISENRPLFVGFYSACAIKDRVITHIKAIKEKFPNVKIYIGGPDIYDCESYLDAGADAYCIGEGEITIVDLLANSQDLMPLASIKGIAYKENGKLIQTPPRELIQNLDVLPIPAWDKFDLNNYYDYHFFDMVKPYTSIIASRGCPFNCSYCISHKIWRKKYRRRSPEHVMKEIDFLVEKCGVKYVSFQDDIWSWLDDDWARKFCRLLISRKYKIKWKCIIHPFSFMRSRWEIIPLMKKSGCTSITIGLQSASREILKNIHRSPKEPEAVAELITLMNKLKILNNTEFIFGLPGETEQTIEESILYAIKTKPIFCGFYSLSMLPGSEICQQEKDGKFNKLPDAYLKKKCSEAAKRFYTNPAVAFNIIKAVIRSNPFWLLRALKNLKYIFEVAGVKKSNQ